MKFRVPPAIPLSAAHRRRRSFTSFLNKLQTPRASSNGGASNSSKGSSSMVPGATLATLAMLGLLHARRLYDDRKLEQAREKGIEIEFQPDAKASFLTLLPLRSISRFWGSLTSVELPVWLRPGVYRAWARAFHSNLEEVAKPLDEYASLREFFVRDLREGSRPIDSTPSCLISPVDGTILRFGELKEASTLIEQVKGFSYSLSSLLGASQLYRVTKEEDLQEESSEQEITPRTEKKSWRRIALASPRIRDPAPGWHIVNFLWDGFLVCLCSECVSKRVTLRIFHSSMKGLFYCVIYLSPGDYHRVHSPVDWNILVRRHFSGRLFPVNERATRTIRNLYVENERVVLEGRWQEGFIAMAAVGATNIGSIELSVEPDLRTNRPRKKLMHLEPPQERIYEPEGVGVMVKKGDEIAAFNMGSTVVVVFQAPISKSSDDNPNSSEFKFCINRGDRVRMGEALGRWHEE